MKKISVISVILCICLVFGVVWMPVSASDSVAVTAGCYSVDARHPLGGSEKKTESAQAIFLYELNTDTFVYGWNADALIDPTGMVKLLTALVVLEQGNLDEIVEVKGSTVYAAELIGSMSVNLKAGEQLSVRDLLYCVMVSSGNDATAVLAEHIAGSQEAFVVLMNERAQQLGCNSSQFANVHGLSGTSQYTTARDLARIAEAALENPLFAEMFCTAEYTVPATNKSDERQLKTTNQMMLSGKFYDRRITGGKTAAASLTDRSLICTAEIGDSRYLCVVMGAEAVVSEDGFVVESYGSFEETVQLLDYASDSFAVRQVVDTQQAYGQYAVTDGANDVVAHSDRDLFVMLPVDATAEDLDFHAVMDADALTAPIKKGAPVGTLEVRYQNIVLGTCQLEAMHSVEQRGTVIQNAEYWEEAEKASFDYMGLLLKIGLVIVVLALAGFAVLAVIRLIRRGLQRHKRRKYSRDRRKGR